MPTDKQKNANRANASKSTGPRSKAGKEICRLNAMKHGLTAEKLVVRGECAEEFQAFQQAIFGSYDPQGPLETQMVARLVSLWWRVQRIPQIEAAMISFKAVDLQQTYRIEMISAPGLEQPFPKLVPRGQSVGFHPHPHAIHLELGLAIEGLMRKDNLSKLSRYEAHLVRQLRDARAELDAVVDNRRGPKLKPKGSGTKTVSASPLPASPPLSELASEPPINPSSTAQPEATATAPQNGWSHSGRVRENYIPPSARAGLRPSANTPSEPGR